MQFQRIGVISALLAASILTGCTEPGQSPPVNQLRSHWIEDNTAEDVNNPDAIVQRIKAKDFSEKDSFEADFRRHVTFYFKDGTKAYPTEGDIWSSVALGNHAYVMLHYPKGADRLAVLEYTKQEKNWMLGGVSYDDVQNIKKSSSARGLNLPFSTFQAIMSSSTPNGDDSVWFFHTKSQTILLTVVPKQDVQGEDWKETTLANGQTAYFQEKQERANLYYVEDNQIVLLSGNVSLKQLKKLARSIAPVDSADFPYS
ncbi:hypothetical protein [Exiguobacterium acetylicum]|uniref:hypothetical protein n=1 Tax=Exiguobacterium acetylicum TaxID=41170 RepID=UPI000682987E|nr:hypothetical protein [Exiguobacterium acetylicum]KNH32898.1 hypothetical protein ACS74_13380 [Exiguobacterium acetylicum]